MPALPADHPNLPSFLLVRSCFPSVSWSFLLVRSRFLLVSRSFLLRESRFPSVSRSFLLGGSRFLLVSRPFLLGGSRFLLVSRPFPLGEELLPLGAHRQRGEAPTCRDRMPSVRLRGADPVYPTN